MIQHNNQPKDSVGSGKIFFEETQLGRNVWGGLLLVILGGELSVGKIKNRESDGALDFDGFCWMGGRNNQPKVGRNDGIYFGETARRVMTIGESAVASFGPSNYWTKINKMKFVVTLGGRQSTIAHNNQPN